MYSFPYLQSVCCSMSSLTDASWPAYRFLKRQIRWSGIPISFRIFFSLLWSTQSKALEESIKQKYMFFPLLFQWPSGYWQFVSGSSAFSKSSLNIWKFTVHILLKSGLENVEHYFTSVWDECNCAVVWTFFGIAFLRDWDENWFFPDLWPLEFSKFCCG